MYVSLLSSSSCIDCNFKDSVKYCPEPSVFSLTLKGFNSVCLSWGILGRGSFIMLNKDPFLPFLV